ncbi:MAG: hypothetical protein IPJ20_05635 [Flammeovirgaceae bacterium]|nr:hypothetical protein [Flammeovirgaceae bacterium]
MNNAGGFQNTAIGNQALRSNTSGSINSALGYFSMYSNTTGGDNTAYGVQTLQTNSNGSFNTAIGKNSLRNSSGSNNTGVGFETLYSNSSGTNNTAIGYSANVGSGSLTNATAIGSGASVNASNTIQLGDANVTKVYAGTGTAVTLVAGGLQITGGTPAAGKVLTSDVAGLATWQMPASLPTGTTPGQMMYWNGTTWVILVPPANNGFIYTLKVVNGSLFWEAGDTDGDGIPDSDEAPECINDPNC